jgi:CRP-like cAMP-binding protein
VADATSSPILHSTPASEWLDVVGHGIRRLLPAERVIYRQGQQAEHLHLLLMGRVRISAVTPDGDEIVLALIEPPASFGEAACLDRLPQYATAVTSTECEVVSFPRQTALRLMQEDLPLLEEVLAGLTRKQRLHAGQLQAVSNQSAPGRIALLLAHLVADYGVARADGAWEISLHLSHEELARMSGTTRVTVTRQLGRLAGDGVLVKEGRRLVVVDLDRLRARGGYQEAGAPAPARGQKS